MLDALETPVQLRCVCICRLVYLCSWRQRHCGSRAQQPRGTGMAQQIGKPDRCDVYPLPLHAAAATQNEQKGLGGCGEGQTDVMTALIRPQSGALLWKLGQKPTSWKQSGFRGKIKRWEGTGADFSVSRVCYRHTLFRLIICLRATGHIYLDGGDKGRRGLNEFLEAIIDTSGQKSSCCQCEEQKSKSSEKKTGRVVLHSGQLFVYLTHPGSQALIV